MRAHMMVGVVLGNNPHYARITNYVRDLAVRVADLDHRVVVDQPKPDPAGECRQ